MHRCGYHKSVASDPDNLFAPELESCPVCAGLTAYHRQLQAEEQAVIKKRGDQAAPGAPLPSDGRTVWMRQLLGEEAEVARRDLAARQHVQQPPGDQRPSN